MSHQQLKIKHKKSKLNEQKNVLKTIIEIKKKNKNVKIPLRLIRSLDLAGVESHLHKVDNFKRMVNAAIKIQSMYRAYKSKFPILYYWFKPNIGI